MGFLDLFKPKWKNSDPEVRAAAVRDLESSDAAILQQVVRADEDARVRRLALKKIDDPALLAELAERDPDEALRRAAGEKASDLLLSTALAAGDEALAALSRLSAPRAVAEVAKRGADERVRLAALARLTDEKGLAEVARHAGDALMRKQAVERIEDPAVLRDVAISDTVKEVALEAVARLHSRAMLEAVAKRTKSKAVRAAVREKLGDAEPPPAAGAARPADSSNRQAQLLQLCRAVESAAQRRDLEQAGREIDQARSAWSDLGAQPGDEEIKRRFERACERFWARRSEQARLQQPKGPSPAELARAAEAQAAAEQARAAAAEERRKQDEARAALDAERRKEAEAQRAQDEARRAEERARRAEEQARRAEEQARRRAAQEAEQAAELVRLEQLSERLEQLCATDDRKQAEQGLKAAQSAHDGNRALPRQGGPAARERFSAARAKLVIRLNELREAEDWKRWSNVPKLEQLCARVEALLTATDLKVAAQELRAAQADWKTAGGAPKDKLDALWARFKKASDEVHERCRVHFAGLDEERKANLKKKEELCVRVEGLVESTDWKETAELIKLLQEEWKAVGAVQKEQSDAIWRRFREACDRFFERRKTHFGQLDQERATNLALHKALCEKVEAVADSTEWKSTGDLIKSYQAEWKTVGPAPRDESEAVWKRFRDACDRFFDRRKAHFDQLDQERAANLTRKEELCTRVEALFGSEDLPSAVEQVQQLHAEWKTIGPAPRDHADAIWQRFCEASDRVRARLREQERAAQEQARPQPEPVAAEPATPPPAQSSRFENKLPLAGIAELLAAQTKIPGNS